MYDGNAHGEAAIANVTEGTKITYSVDGGKTWKDEFPTITDVGKVTVQVKAENANYTTATANYTLEVTHASVTVTANDKTKVYGDKDPALTAKVEGNLNGDEIAYTLSRAVGENVGTYPITPTGEEIQGNYKVTYVQGNLEITKRGLGEEPEEKVTITAKDVTATYDGQPHGEDGYTSANLAEGDKVAFVTISGSQTNVGTYNGELVPKDAKIVNAAGEDMTGNYEITYNPGTLTINKCSVTIVVASASKTFGDADPAFTGTVTGLVAEGDLGIVTYVRSNTEEAVGNYIGVLEPRYTVNSNYDVTVTNGDFEITAKNIVPGKDNKDLTATAPENVVYSGESQQQKPIVKDGDKTLVEGTDYTLTYSKDTKNVGTVTVTINGKGNYDGKFYVTYKITPAPLKITTNSAEKTYDESALTAGGKIEGLVKGETATLKTTGSQTEVGSSQNTYEIVWGTAKASNYEITEDIGTLKVNKRSSGGGGSSKPTPEEEPTPTPTPTPTLPTTPAPTTPARRVTRSTATVTTEPASRPTEQITENETPKAESEPEVIEDEETPLAPMATGAWALVNLILMLLTVLASLLLLLGYLGKKKYAKEDEYGNALHDANGNEIIDYTRNKKGFWRVASLIPAIAAVIAFALTENMRLPMVMTDRWTLLMVIIAVVQLIVAVLCKKKKESEEDENQANA